MLDRATTHLRRAAGALGASLLVILAAACTSPALPASLTSDAPASSQASAAPIASAAVVLTEDPPLPGEPSERWPGLGGDTGAPVPVPAPAPAPAPADHHHHHHAHHGGEGHHAP